MTNKTALDELQEVTKTNLPKEFKGLYDLSEEVTHFTRRCNIEAALNRLIQANRAATRLNERAKERYEDGSLTADEYIQITRLTEEIVYQDLTGRIRAGLFEECGCKFRD